MHIAMTRSGQVVLAGGDRQKRIAEGANYSRVGTFNMLTSYQWWVLFGVFGRYNNLWELRVCKVCRRHAR